MSFLHPISACDDAFTLTAIIFSASVFGTNTQLALCMAIAACIVEMVHAGGTVIVLM